MQNVIEFKNIRAMNEGGGIVSIYRKQDNAFVYEQKIRCEFDQQAITKRLAELDAEDAALLAALFS